MYYFMYFYPYYLILLNTKSKESFMKKLRLMVVDYDKANCELAEKFLSCEEIEVEAREAYRRKRSCLPYSTRELPEQD